MADRSGNQAKRSTSASDRPAELTSDPGSLLRSLLASSGDCIKILDLDGNLIFMTEGGQRIMEVTDFSAIAGCPWPDFWQGQGNTDARAAVEAAKAGRAANFQGFATTMAGTPKWWDVHVTPILGTDGKPEKLLSVSRDITDSRTAAKAVEASERQLRLALHAGRLGYWTLNLATGVVTASDICKETFGYAASDNLTFDNIRAAVHPDDRARMAAARKRTIETGEDYDIEYRTLKPDGSTGWIMIRGQLVRDDRGNPVEWSGVSLDIGSLKRAEAALVESETRFKTFAQAMPNQVWSATPDGQLDWFNDQVYSYSGLVFDDLKGSGWAQIVHPDDIGSASAGWSDALSRGGTYQTQFRLRRADGSWRWHLARALPIKDPAGVTMRWIGTNTDIDDQKATELALKQAESQQQLLTAELEHRMKNTMAMVGAVANQTFRAAATKEEALASFTARLHALNQAHDILTKSNWTSAPMLAVVEGALAPHRTGEGRFRIAGPDLQLTAKQGLSLALVLHELVTNATKYGALSVPTGMVDIKWDCPFSSDGPVLRFEWRESGGPAVTSPKRRGFGSVLIERTLSADFGGTVEMDFNSTGLVCRFETIRE